MWALDLQVETVRVRELAAEYIRSQIPFGATTPDWKGMVVYVGAIRKLYERDGVAVPPCLVNRRRDVVLNGSKKVAVEVMVFVAVCGRYYCSVYWYLMYSTTTEG